MKTFAFFVVPAKQVIFVSCLCAVSFAPCRAQNAYRQSFVVVSPPNGLQVQHVEAVSSDALSPLHFGQSSPQKGPYKPGIIIGSVMFFGGGVLYAAGHILADHAYDDYHKSAFTGNTDRLRREIVKYNVMRFGGGALGGIGLIAVLVSF